MKIGAVPAAKITGYMRPQVKPAETRELNLGSDSIEISQSARLFAQNLRAAQAAPEIRTDKVKEIADRIANGTYKIDSQAIAAKMLEQI